MAEERKLETLEQIMDMWDRDSKVDTTEPAQEIMKVPNLHSKYARILSGHSMKIRQINFDIAKMKKIKWEYYNGRLAADDLKKYGLEPFQFVLKADISYYLESDNDILNLNMRKSRHEEAFKFTESVMKELGNRTWQLKEFMAWEKFIAGQK